MCQKQDSEMKMVLLQLLNVQSVLPSPKYINRLKWVDDDDTDADADDDDNVF